MPLTSKLDLPTQKAPSLPWSIRKIVSNSGEAIATVVKTHNPMEFAFLFMLVCTFILELFRSYPSFEWWIIMALILGISAFEKFYIPKNTEKPEDTV